MKCLKSILIIDDSLLMRRIIKRDLASSEFSVVGEAYDGNTALFMYKRLKPDLVTLDIAMPGKNGIDILHDILNVDKNAKVVMVTSLGQDFIIKESIMMGASNFITKPFTGPQLVQVINSVLITN